MANEPLVSHGRGGAANISRDDTPYTDGEIVREGLVGDQGDGAFSTGRGGAANIGSPGLRPTKKTPHDTDMIPETALRRESLSSFHTGRGGEGNVHKDNAPTHNGLADKLKNKIFGGGKA